MSKDLIDCLKVLLVDILSIENRLKTIIVFSSCRIARRNATLFVDYFVN